MQRRSERRGGTACPPGTGDDERHGGGSADAAPGPLPGEREGHNLAELAPGARATVVRVTGGPPGTARRLGDLGFTPGTVVEVVRRAPLRDPVIYRVKDYEICLRRAQAACVRTSGVH